MSEPQAGIVALILIIISGTIGGFGIGWMLSFYAFKNNYTHSIKEFENIETNLRRWIIERTAERKALAQRLRAASAATDGNAVVVMRELCLSAADMLYPEDTKS
jgi:hypothetical protein